MSQKGRRRRIQKSIKKATRGNPKPPKEKHTRSIVLQTFNKDDSIQEILRGLVRRLDKSNWMVVLKALQIFHRCYRDGDQQFIESLKSRSTSIFALRRFNAANMKGHVITVFIRKYAKYLEEKVSVLRLLGFQFEKQPDACKKLKLDHAFKRIPKLQSQLNALLNCKMKSHHVTQHALIVTTYVLLLKDSLILYRILNEGIVSILDQFESMSKKSAQKTLDIYKLFIRETDALIALYDVGRHFTRSLPDIKKAKTSIVDSMQKHINKLDGSKTDDVNVPDDDVNADDLEESIAGSIDDPGATNPGQEAESDEEESSEEAVANVKVDLGANANVQIQAPEALFDPFGLDETTQKPTLAADSSTIGGLDVLAPDTQLSNKVALSYQEKASTIKDLANTLYDTSFNNFNNQFSTKVNDNPFVDQSHPSFSGYQGAQNPFGIGSTTTPSIYNTAPNPGQSLAPSTSIYNTNPNNNFIHAPLQPPTSATGSNTNPFL